MPELHELTDSDAQQLGRIVADLLKLGEDLALDGSARGFQVYKLARDAVDILTQDRLSRDTMVKLMAQEELFQGYKVSEIVRHNLTMNKKIDAIKEFRSETGLGLKEAKDWVEAYAAKHNLLPSW